METKELTKLSEESLTQQPEEVFDILSKLGEGSYGSVFKALHKESNQILAIKQVPVDTDLQDIIKEISIMQQCDSPYVVKYYGSYFKNTDLWIVMEYCGAGSVLDIMKLRGIYHNMPKGAVKTLSENEIATILSDTLKGLEYLHLRKKIHRDIKGGNILLNSEGHAKLADFGVAGQLTDTMAKRNTIIGSPYWMAPEVIQEIGYDCAADIWSLGITALEMAEGKAPYADIHPMRAIFMIPGKPPPSFNKPDEWSGPFIEFVSRCLVKSPEKRATASELLQHEFMQDPKPPESLNDMIKEAQDVRERLPVLVDHSRSLSRRGANEGNTLISEGEGTLIRHDTENDDGTMIQHATLISHDTNKSMVEVESNLGTMVINDEEEDEDTMKRHDTPNYRPSYLDHFDQGKASAVPSGKENDKPEEVEQPSKPMNAHLQKQLEQIAGKGMPEPNIGDGMVEDKKVESFQQQSLLDGDFEFLKYLSYEELTYRMTNIDAFMEREIDELRRRYHAKRQPILDAMDHKRKMQQKF